MRGYGFGAGLFSGMRNPDSDWVPPTQEEIEEERLLKLKYGISEDGEGEGEEKDE